MKDRVVFNAADKSVEGLWLNTKFAAKAFRAMDLPVIKQMELGNLWDRWCRMEDTSC